MPTYKVLPVDTRTDAEREESYRYWAKQSASAKFSETLRLSIEHYGTPIGDLRDGPLVKCERLPDGSLHILSERSGPNPLRYSDDESL